MLWPVMMTNCRHEPYCRQGFDTFVTNTRYLIVIVQFAFLVYRTNQKKGVRLDFQLRLTCRVLHSPPPLRGGIAPLEICMPPLGKAKGEGGIAPPPPLV